MKKRLAYWEQLRHPKWQKRRLEVLSNAEWACEQCGEKDENLQVHHKQYFRGRMAWEYSDEELLVLCEKCHDEAGRLDEALKQILVTTDQNEIVPFLAGYIHGNSAIDPGLIEECRQTNPFEFYTGLVARIIGSFPIERQYEVAKFAASLAKHKKSADARLKDCEHYMELRI